MDQELALEAAALIKDARYRQSRTMWLASEYVTRERGRARFPARFVLVDTEGTAHGPYKAGLVITSYNPPHPWIITSPDASTVFRVIGHDSEWTQVWTEDDEVLKVVELS